VVPLLVMLQRLADYDPALLAPELPLLAFLLSLGSGQTATTGRERSLLLAVLRAVVAGGGDNGDAVITPAALRWCIFPLVVLTGMGGAEGAEAGTTLALLEKIMVAASTTSPSPLPPSTALHALLEAPSAELLPALHEAVGRLRASSPSSSKDWCLFLAMGALFDAQDATQAGAALAPFERLVGENKLDKLAGPRLLPALLYLLNRWRGRGRTTAASPQLQHRLLSLLPALGGHQVGAQMVQALLQRLASAQLEPSGDKARDERLRVVLGSAALTLSTALFRRNTRALPRLRDLLLLATSPPMTGAGLADRGASLASDAVDEHKLARALAILEVVKEDPEAGSEFVGLVQDYLTDPLPGVVAAAVDCVTYLCTADCLDYWAAIRILQKKGRVNHQGHPLVLANLADLYGAAPLIFDCSPLAPAPSTATAAPTTPGASAFDEEEDGDGGRARLQDWQLARLTDYLWLLTEQADGGVRGRAYAALGGYVPLLLASEDAEVAQDVRDRLLRALQEEASSEARAGGLHEAVRAAVRAEADDSGTWRRTLLAAGTGGTASGAVAGAGGGEGKAGPSRKTLRALPTATEVLTLYRKRRDIPGLAGASLHALGSRSGGHSGDGCGVDLLELFTDALSDEDGGGRCFLHRLLVPQSFLRFLPALLAELAGAAAGKGAALAGTLEAVGAVEQTLQAILDDDARRDGAANNALLALAALANALPPQLAHKVPGIVRTLEGTLLSDAGASIALDVPALLVSLGLAGRCLGAADAGAVHDLASRVLLGHVQSARFGGGSRTDLDACLWGSLVGAGALTDWARQIYSPDVATLRLLACVARACLEVLAQGPLRGSRSMAGLCREEDEDVEGGTFSVSGMQQRAARQSAAVVSWETLTTEAGAAVARRADGDEDGAPPLAVLGAAWGLALLAPNLAHVGLEQQLLQLFHVLRAASAAAADAAPGVDLALAAVLAQAVKGGLIGPEEVLAILKDGLERLSSNSGGGGVTGGQEGLVLGLAHLVVAVQGALSLPLDVTDGLRRLLLARLKDGSKQPPQQQDVQERAAVLLALYTLLANGGPLVNLLGSSVGKGFGTERTTAATATELVAALRADLASPSERQRSAAARVMGLLVALREEEEQDGQDGDGFGGGEKGVDLVGAGGGGGAVHRIDPATFGLPSEGTLLRDMVAELLRLVVGDGTELAAPAGRAFVASALKALGECGVLKFQHKQMALVLQNVLRAMLPRLAAAAAAAAAAPADKDSSSSSPLGLIRACLAFAVKAAPRDQAYVTWLYDVGVNAPVPVLDLLLPHLPALVRLTPSGLLGQLLGTLWAKLGKPGEQGQGLLYERLGRLLTGLARGAVAASERGAGATKGGGGGGGGRGSGAKGGTSGNSIEALWGFVQKDVLRFVTAAGGAFAGDLSAWLAAYYTADDASPDGPASPFTSVLEPLVALLAALGRAQPSLDLAAAIAPLSCPAALLLTSLLVGQGALAISALDAPRLALLGPAEPTPKSLLGGCDPSTRRALLPFVVATVWRAASGAPSLQQQWLLALLEYLQVAPARLAPLVVLVYLITEWGPVSSSQGGLGLGLGLALLREAPLRSKLRSLHRALGEDGGDANLEERVRLDALSDCAGRLLGALEAAQAGAEVAVLSRVVKILAAAAAAASSSSSSSLIHQQQRRRLHHTLLRVVGGATARPRQRYRGGRAAQQFLGFGRSSENEEGRERVEPGVADQLPALKTLVSQWVVAEAARAGQEV
jgi:hypothetical protein